MMPSPGTISRIAYNLTVALWKTVQVPIVRNTLRAVWRVVSVAVSKAYVLQGFVIQ